MKQDFKRWSVKVWKNGKFLDLWSVNHTLAGGLLGAVIYFYNIDFYFGFFISFMIMLAWEIIEIINGLHEEKWNKVTDVITGVFGFTIIYILFSEITVHSSLIVFWVISILWALLESWGFLTLRIKN
ncbi:MAG: hypothetical protein WC735_03155 [Candidatus Paceibacterota bacterium]|jgi:hypothetical protein